MSMKDEGSDVARIKRKINEVDKICKSLDEISINLSQLYQDIVGEIWNSNIGLIHVHDFRETYRGEITDMCRTVDFKLDDLRTWNNNIKEDALNILERKIARLRGD